MKKFTTFIGIDVSKLTLDVSVINDNGLSPAKYQQFKNHPNQLRQIIRFVSQNTSSSKSDWLFCMEHTGIYTVYMCSFLSSQKFNYALVPAIEIQKSMGIRRGKSDKADSRAIAKYAMLRKDEIKLYSLPEKNLTKLKLLLSYRDRLVKSKKLIHTVSKEMDEFLTKDLTKEILTGSIRLTKTFDNELARVNDKIISIINEDKNLKEQYDLIISVPGIGPQTAIHLIVATRGFTAFGNARQLACYAGVAPFEYTSGSSIRGKTRVHPLADKKLKSLLGLCALNSRKSDQQMAQYYQRKTQEGKNPMSVINAMKNKLLLRVFSTVKRGTPYVFTMNYAA
jgi:transposase